MGRRDQNMLIRSETLSRTIPLSRGRGNIGLWGRIVSRTWSILNNGDSRSIQTVRDLCTWLALSHVGSTTMCCQVFSQYSTETFIMAVNMAKSV